MDAAQEPAQQRDGSAATGQQASTRASSPAAVPGAARSPGLARWLLLYTVLRFGLLFVLAAALSLVMPLILAVLFAVVLALPLSWVLLGGARRQVTAAVGIASAHRRAERERLRAALDGQPITEPRAPRDGPERR